MPKNGPEIRHLSTALIVDDDPIIQMVVGRYLRSHYGFDILVAGNGREAGALIEGASGEIALLVCDLHMPDCNGVELLEYLQEKGFRAPVLFVTGARREIAEAATFLARAKRLQVLGLLRKPVDLAKLSSLIAFTQHPAAVHS